MTDLDFLAPIILTEHARRRIRERFGRVDDRAVRGEIRVAIAEGRVATRRPDWTRILTTSRKMRDTFYLWDTDATRCWVVGRSDRELLVATLLLERDTLAQRGQELRLLGARQA